MKTIVSQLDEFFGANMVSFIRDPTQDAITVSVAKSSLADWVGWRMIMGASFCVRTMKEKDWENYVLEALKASRP